MSVIPNVAKRFDQDAPCPPRAGILCNGKVICFCSDVADLPRLPISERICAEPRGEVFYRVDHPLAWSSSAGRRTASLDPRSSPRVLGRRAEELVRARIGEVEARNARFFDEEVQRLDRWADDLKFGLEREIRDLDKRIKEVCREARAAISLTDNLAAQKRIRRASRHSEKPHVASSTKPRTASTGSATS